MRLRSIIFKFHELNKILLIEVMRLVHAALYKSIMCYGLIVWGWCAENATRPKNLAVRNKYDMFTQKYQFKDLHH